MKMNDCLHGYVKNALLICFFISCTAVTVYYGFAQNNNTSMEVALEKYNRGDFQGALAEIERILQDDPDNVEAKKLQNKIVNEMNRQKSQELTELALIEIDKKNFNEAQDLLAEAIRLDADNKRARELYLTIEEIRRMGGITSDEEQAALIEEHGTTDVIHEQEKSRRTNFYVKLTPLLVFSNSNAVAGLDSGVTQMGAKVDIVYYFDFWESHLGVSLDYAGSFLKFSGLEEINFILHKANVSARFRIHLFEQDSHYLELGAKLSYHLYYMQNLESQGAYNFTLLYTPSFGIFFSDPVLARFMENDFLENCGLEGEANFFLIPGAENQAWLFNLEFYLGVYYQMGSFCFSLGYNYYSIMREALSETSHGIGVGVTYYF